MHNDTSCILSDTFWQIKAHVDTFSTFVSKILLAKVNTKIISTFQVSQLRKGDVNRRRINSALTRINGINAGILPCMQLRIYFGERRRIRKGTKTGWKGEKKLRNS